MAIELKRLYDNDTVREVPFNTSSSKKSDGRQLIAEGCNRSIIRTAAGGLLTTSLALAGTTVGVVVCRVLQSATNDVPVVTAGDAERGSRLIE